MLCLSSLTRGRCPLGPPLLPERPNSTIRNGWGKFCSIEPRMFYAALSTRLPCLGQHCCWDLHFQASPMFHWIEISPLSLKVSDYKDRLSLFRSNFLICRHHLGPIVLFIALRGGYGFETLPRAIRKHCIIGWLGTVSYYLQSWHCNTVTV